MNGKVNFLKEVTINAGNILMDYFRKNFEILDKEGSELVTTADNKSEIFIMESIRKRFPDAGIVAEESNYMEWDREEVFIIDPLDGTSNFAYGIPFFSISIAYQLKGELNTGVIYDPVHEELFSSQKGKGSYLNGKKVRVSIRKKLKNSILATGFPYIRKRRDESNIPEFTEFLMASRGIRRIGSAALDLAYVSCGRLDGFWERGLKPWDISAGGIMVFEAGGKVSNFDDEGWDNSKDHIIASNRKIHREMFDIINKI